jgi:propionate CoA-transferase
MSGWQFAANLYAEALLDGVYQFDFIDGGNCKFAALAFAQFDAGGNVNVSRFDGFNPGAAVLSTSPITLANWCLPER